MSSSDDSASYWNFGDTREDPIHRIHSYPAKFPAFITTKALRYAEQQGLNVKVIADVFCGCGTTAVEAKRNGKNFWGCDINPVATLIAKVKTRHYQDTVLVRYFDAIQDGFGKAEPSPEDRARVNDRITVLVRRPTCRRTAPARPSHPPAGSRQQPLPRLFSVRVLQYPEANLAMADQVH